MKYSDITLGKIEAVINKLGGMEGVEKFLSGDLSVCKPVCLWREQDGAIYFSVTSDGTTGPQLINRLEKKGFWISDHAKSILCSPDFKPTSGVTYEIVVLKGMLFEDRDRITKKIRAEAERRNFIKPNAEIACFIREKFTNKELDAMGLWRIVVMHEPIKDSGGDPNLLGVGRNNAGHWLSASCDKPDNEWHGAYGFAFVFSQVGP
jgi:hypothetical protein